MTGLVSGQQSRELRNPNDSEPSISSPAQEPRRDRCPICDSQAEDVGTKLGATTGLRFHIARCPACGFAFVADPWVEFDRIYSEDYYAGRGADPLVNYVDELEHVDTTIRTYEWRGVLARLRSLVPVGSETVWLDYGCGTGGLVRYLRSEGLVQAVGTEQGASLARLVEDGVPVLGPSELESWHGRFDVVTAIEVIEHVVDPVAELRRICALLRPGGVAFITTGNAKPYARRLLGWHYLRPEVHVSLFEPESLAVALRTAGLSPSFPGYGPGWTSIIRYKVLKNLRRRSVGGWERAVPWSLVARGLDRRLGLSAHPVGWAS